MKPFSEIAEDLKPDGASRDFYIFGIDLGIWQLFLDSVRPFIGSQDFRIDRAIAPLPSQASEIFAIRSSASPCLSIRVGSGIVNCHFFCETELELDFAPRDYATEEKWTELCEFFAKLCVKLNKAGLVSYENMPDQVIETFSGAST